MNDIDRQRKVIDEELNLPNQHPKVINHYKKLKESLEGNGTPKILVIHPCCSGDIITSSISAELFKIKYPGCLVDYVISEHNVINILKTNPFINEIHLVKDWAKFGGLKPNYDKCYSLYWWSKPSWIKSFLGDLELPTDYTRVKIYLTEEQKKYAKEFWKGIPDSDKKIRICLNTDAKTTWSNRPKWNYEKLKILNTMLKDYGCVLQVGMALFDPPADRSRPFIDEIVMISEADFYIGIHGGMDVAAAAVGTQTIVTMNIGDPAVMAASSYQNPYRPTTRPCTYVEPRLWCHDHWGCVSDKVEDIYPHRAPIGFPQQHCPPHMVRPCNFGFPITCTHEIQPEQFVEKLEEMIKLREQEDGNTWKFS